MITELTASMISSYKKCPRRYELEYIHELKSTESSEALTIGTNYHANVEKILKHEDYDHEGLSGKMAEAFEKYIEWQDWEAQAEEEFRVRLTRGVYLKGKLDARTKDGIPVEHKTTGQYSLEKYIDHLAYDDQIAIYMLVTGSKRAIYTIMQKPTIRQGRTETEDEYLNRVSSWYSPEHVKSVNVVRSAGELEAKREELIYLARQIRQTKLFWRNPNSCAITTCPYASICLSYEPDMQVMGYEKKERRNEELCRY
jgi:hypothetical protein